MPAAPIRDVVTLFSDAPSASKCPFISCGVIVSGSFGFVSGLGLRSMKEGAGGVDERKDSGGGRGIGSTSAAGGGSRLSVRPGGCSLSAGGGGEGDTNLVVRSVLFSSISSTDSSVAESVARAGIGRITPTRRARPTRT